MVTLQVAGVGKQASLGFTDRLHLRMTGICEEDMVGEMDGKKGEFAIYNVSSFPNFQTKC